MNLDRIYILDPTDRNLEVIRFDNGDIGLHCGAHVSASDAQQLCNGILAVLSGQFDRAISEYSLRFDLDRRRPQSGSVPSQDQPHLPQPELDTL